jgi:hypothetical protein
MTTKHRFRNQYRIELRERDHQPAHVHVTGGGIDLLVYLETFTTEGECPATVKREALAWIKEHAPTLIEEWKQWHP